VTKFSKVTDLVTIAVSNLRRIGLLKDSFDRRYMRYTIDRKIGSWGLPVWKLTIQSFCLFFLLLRMGNYIGTLRFYLRVSTDYRLGHLVNQPHKT